VGKFFKTDTAALRDALNRQKTALEESRKVVEPLWRECRDFIEPTMGRGLSDSPDISRFDAKAVKILHSECRILVPRMASGLQTGMTNPAQSWFRLTPDEASGKIGSATREWLSQATEQTQAWMRRSNVYLSLVMMYKHLAVFGTACGVVSEVGDGLPHMQVFDAGNYWIGEGEDGRVNCLCRNFLAGFHHWIFGMRPPV